MNRIYAASNNGIIAVMGEGGWAKHEQLMEIIREGQNKLVAEGKYPFGNDTELWSRAQAEVGRIPVATFAPDENFVEYYRPFVTGTHSEYKRLALHCQVNWTSFGVPWSVSGVDKTLTLKDAEDYICTFNEMLDIFGVEAVSLNLASA